MRYFQNSGKVHGHFFERDQPQGMIETGKLKVKVILTNVDERGFTFRLSKPLMPKVKIMLSVSKFINLKNCKKVKKNTGR